ncbi:UDP-N-acetylglucosamine 2-epimerase (hydrolyzing) [Candidatus Methylopumilus universalis]|uniref:UDP-N-acetylglucosamine 2-epimerase (Hydrolyzing) n=2 Tax=Candidatus Methylopumilus universalis TaxID=2588536 RepID=A0ABX5VXN9_9PROT|nr:UDP-N-acetylglucosamine 2-epimerase [Candidatus Methylopumilus universalis]QDC51748.1 UDP-N-acetylglucosamine 2-epimerase (hydrolyzing) [Candidatus Methylopumilus universalis]QDC61884.1 UDP-N-acetylglucosamine 2-epimerase (hydrolyzing) [Candidatus Methylopumilus universalis]
MNFRKIVFLTGTRADFGKLKSLMLRLQSDEHFDVHVFITGMHMLSRYGSTWEEVRKAGLVNIYRFINQNEQDSMDQILSKTICGLSDYVKEITPDMIVVHGDRVEALAGAIVGSLNNIRVAHIEGGEVSGTVDEIIRHSISKMSHFHFVANDEARRRLVQLGESKETIYVIGSPDIDIMNSPELPTLEKVKSYYHFNFKDYAILMFHPVTTEYRSIQQQISTIVDCALQVSQNFVVLYPNNDHGTEFILQEYERLQGCSRFAIYPSMRFEYFLTLLKHANYIIGNSSAGIREAPHFGVPTINLGSRQHRRVQTSSVINVSINCKDIVEAIKLVQVMPRISRTLFGNGNSAGEFIQVLQTEENWDRDIQKYFIDYPSK